MIQYKEAVVKKSKICNVFCIKAVPFFRSCLDYLTRPGLLSERISSLTGEADQKTVGTLIVDHIFLINDKLINVIFVIIVI